MLCLFIMTCYGFTPHLFEKNEVLSWEQPHVPLYTFIIYLLLITCCKSAFKSKDYHQIFILLFTHWFKSWFVYYRDI